MSLPEPTVREKTSVPQAEAWPQHFDNVFWARLADRCLSCRLCAYVCPTCRCFDVRDNESPGKEIKRLRAWDSCMAENYRRIAGGHNPRPAKADRLRNRFYCKFCYYPQDYGPVACVGCGRCIDKCPANVDIVEVLEGVATL
jgi:formate hydrogenlyase subunit 6/NADH:ubiquinone oxidoreductase subunit I